MDNELMDAGLTDILEQNGFGTGGSGGHLQSLGPGLFQVTLPDGEEVLVDGTGHIVQ